MTLTAVDLVEMFTEGQHASRDRALELVRELYARNALDEQGRDSMVDAVLLATTPDQMLAALPPGLPPQTIDYIREPLSTARMHGDGYIPPFAHFGQLLKDVANLRVDDERFGIELLRFVADDAERWQVAFGRKSYERGLRRMDPEARRVETQTANYATMTQPITPDQLKEAWQQAFRTYTNSNDKTVKLAALAGVWYSMLTERGPARYDFDGAPAAGDGLRATFQGPTLWQCNKQFRKLQKQGMTGQEAAVETFRWWLASGNSGVQVPSGHLEAQHKPTVGPRFRAFVEAKRAKPALAGRAQGDASRPKALGNSDPAARSTNHRVR